MKGIASVMFVLLFVRVEAQSGLRDGYIVLNDNTVISGQLRDQSEIKNYSSCLFTAADGTEIEYFPGRKIKGYGFIDDSYFSSEIKEGFFVEALLKGHLSVYKFKERFYLKKDTSIYLLESKIDEVKMDGKTVLKENGNWKGITSYLIGDCQSKINIHNLRLEENSLVKVVSNYNECKEMDYIVFKEKKPFAVFQYGASLGVVHTTLKTQSYQNSFGTTIDYMNDSYSSTDPIIGLAFTAASPRTSENFSFHFGINFIKSNYSSLYVRRRAQQIEYNESNIRLSTLNIPAYLKYTFPIRRVNLSISAGGALENNLKSSTDIYSETVLGTSSEIIVRPNMEAFEVKRNQIGSLIGVGVQKVFKEYSLDFFAQFIQMSTLSESVGFEVIPRRISYGLIISKL